MACGWLRCALHGRGPRKRTFSEPCFGPTCESLALPADARAAAESLDGASLTMAEALGRLRPVIDLHGGRLEVVGRMRAVLWYMPAASSAGEHVFFLIRYR